MATPLSVTVEKCVLHIYTPRQTSLPNFMRIGQKLNSGSSSRRKIFPIFAIICRYHATHFLSLSKKVSCTSTPQGKHLCQISWELVKNWGSSSRTQDFSPIFCHNMPLPWQHSFCHCRKMCLAHLHSKANISAKFHENWSKTELRK